jgi:hypothetical protein
MGFDFYILGLAALLMALNQGLKDAPYIRARFPAFSLPGWVNYIPLPLFILAAIIHFWPADQVQPVPLSGPRVTGIPIEAIAKAVSGITSAQREKSLAPFSSLSASVEGVVKNVDAVPGEFVIVYLGGQIGGRNVILIFRDGLERVSALDVGSPIKATCGFSNIAERGLVLNRCSLEGGDP